MIQKALINLLRQGSVYGSSKGKFPGLIAALLLLALGISTSSTARSADFSMDGSIADTTIIKASTCSNEPYAFAGHLVDTSGVYTAVFTAGDGTDSVVVLYLNVLPVRRTQLQANICEGSEYVFHGDTLNTSGTYIDTLVAVNGCDSIITLKLNVASYFETTINATICDGDVYPFGGIVLAETGVYTDSLTAVGGCDSTIILNLTVLPQLETSLEAAICEGEYYAIGGDTLTVEGIYTAFFQAVSGCDSTVTLTLHVFPVAKTQLEETICDGTTFTFGTEILSAAGTYLDTLSTVNGCDSIVTLVLHVLPNSASAISATICDGNFYELNGAILTETGIYTSVVSNEVGCDSIITLTLTVLPAVSSAIDATICANSSYEYNGVDYNVAGTYTFIYPAANGCDSTVTLTLNVLPAIETATAATICYGESYLFGGNAYVVSGVYTATFTSAAGCDSVVTLTLTVRPEVHEFISATICGNQSYQFGNETLTQSGEYTGLYVDVNGCDSLVTLTLTVIPVGTSVVDATICGNESYPFYGAAYNQTGVYTATLPGTNGCDSIVTLNLTVLPVPSTDLLVKICYGETYTYNGETLSQTGLYNYTYTAANGCDSLVHLTFIVLPQNITQLSYSLCTGSSFAFNGQTITTDGTYTSVSTDSNGCDSTVVVTLTFVNAFETAVAASVCAGQTYTYNGTDLTTAGTYTFPLTAVGGCDSVVTLTLTVLPAYNIESNVTICANESITFAGDVLNTSGVYTAVFVSSAGCDSTVTVNLTVLPLASSEQTVNICEGEFFPFYGQALSASGDYTAVLNGPNGCDSTVIVHLTVNPSYHATVAATICAGETYPFNGTNLTASGTYTQSLSTVSGCDSITVLHLTVLPVAGTNLTVLNCNGAPFVYNNTLLSQTGVYIFPFTSANGCDSIVTIHLTISPAIPPLTISAEICEGDVYDFNGQALNSPGVYTATFNSASGCDSVVILNLGVQNINTTVTLSGITLTAAAGNVQYQWINCATQQPIAGANGASFTPTVTGSYAVQITNTNGCTAVSSCTSVVVVSTRENALDLDWQVQPNPAVSTVFVQLTEPATQTLQVTVTDLAGRTIQHQQLPAGGTSLQLDIAGMPAGMYLLQLADQHGVAVKRFSKL